MLQMKQWGTVLTGRKLGKIVRTSMLSQIDSEIMVVDFKEVRVASHSFCDEAFGKIVFEVEKPTEKLRFINTDENIKTTIKYVLSERLKEKFSPA